MAWIVEPVGRDARSALELLLQALPKAERPEAIERALEMMARGSLDPAGIQVVRSGERIVGAMVGQVAAGAAGLVWPPRTSLTHDRQVVEDALVQATVRWLGQRGVKLCQVLLRPEDHADGLTLLRNGFRQVTQLVFLRHWLSEEGPNQFRSPQLDLTPLSCCDRGLFVETLERTYVGSLDCPELNGVRTMDEVMVGHAGQGKSDLDQWWLACHAGRPVGVLLMNQIIDEPAWEVIYVGLTPEARSRGWGKELVRHACDSARRLAAAYLDITVDVRNVVARKLYAQLGFEFVDQRCAFLHVVNQQGAVPGDEAVKSR